MPVLYSMLMGELPYTYDTGRSLIVSSVVRVTGPYLFAWTRGEPCCPCSLIPGGNLDLVVLSVVNVVGPFNLAYTCDISVIRDWSTCLIGVGIPPKKLKL